MSWRLATGSYATQILQSQRVPRGTLAGHHRRMVVSAHRTLCPRWHTALLRFSEELGIGKERPEHAPQEVGCVRNPGTGAGFGRQCLPGICPNPKRPRVVPGHRCFASVRRELSLLPRRETFSGSGQTYPKTRAQTGSAKRERGNPFGERSGTGYCYELNGRSPPLVSRPCQLGSLILHSTFDL